MLSFAQLIASDLHNPTFSSMLKVMSVHLQNISSMLCFRHNEGIYSWEFTRGMKKTPLRFFGHFHFTPFT